MKSFDAYEKILVQNVECLKQPTIYFFLKTHKFSENYIKNLRNTPSSILLNGQAVNIRAKIMDGDTLEILKSPNAPSKTLPCSGNLKILYEDDDFLFVNKPHNLACTPTRSHYTCNLGGMICQYMQQKDENFVLRVINRLDKEASGIVAVAKNVIAANNLQLNKEYHALCNGNITENTTINKPILTVCENGINQMKRIISPDGKASITHLEVLENYADFCHVKLTLETGRTHQIRVHMASIGHALVGDSLYGKANFLHTMLLLKKVSFQHFRSGKTITLEVPFPEDWQQFLHKERL